MGTPNRNKTPASTPENPPEAAVDGDHVKLEPGVVDFVGGCIRANKVCEIDLSELARTLTRAHVDSLHPMTAYDLWLGKDLPFVLADPSLLDSLVGRLICRAAASMRGGWGTLSVSTGLLGNGAVTIYSGNLYRGLPHAQYAYLEVHDTGNAPSGGDQRAIEEPFLTNHYPDEPLRLATARRLLAHHGGEIRLASSSWFGTSVVLLLPYSVEPDLGIH